jgi:hypothetical protein
VGIAALDVGDRGWGIGWLGHAATGLLCSGQARTVTLGNADRDRLRSDRAATTRVVSAPRRTVGNSCLYSFIDRVSRRCKQTRLILSTFMYGLRRVRTLTLTSRTRWLPEAVVVAAAGGCRAALGLSRSGRAAREP